MFRVEEGSTWLEGFNQDQLSLLVLMSLSTLRGRVDFLSKMDALEASCVQTVKNNNITAHSLRGRAYPTAFQSRDRALEVLNSQPQMCWG